MTSAVFKLKADAGAFLAPGVALAGTNALAYAGSGTYTITAALDSLAGVDMVEWTIISADDLHIASLPTVTTNLDKSCSFTVPKTGGAWLLRCRVNNRSDLLEALKVAVLNARDNEEIAVGERLEASSVYGWARALNTIARSGGAPSGAAGGDLAGAYPNPTVDGLQGRAVSATAPSSGQFLSWDGSAWIPASVSVPGASSSTPAAVSLSAGSAGAGSTFARGDHVHLLSPGTANQVLTTNGSGTAPVWATIVDANIASNAAIAGSKINASFGNQGLVTTNAAILSYGGSPVLAVSSGLVLGDIGNWSTVHVRAQTTINLNINSTIVVAIVSTGIALVGDIRKASLVNNGVTARVGERVRVEQNLTVSAAGAGTLDFTVWQTPTRFVIEQVILRWTGAPSAGGGFTDVTLTLGTSSGGTQVLASKQYLAAGLPVVGDLLGLATAEKGSDFVVANNWVHAYVAAQTLSLRVVHAGGGTTGGTVRVTIIGFEF